MKHLFTFSIFFLVPFFSTGQEFSDSRPFFNVKWTPSSLVNPNTPTCLAGIEIWPSKKVNLQFEYGFPLFVPVQRNKEDRYYRKYKLGIRYHYYPNLNRTSFWRRQPRKSLLPDSRRNFVGIDVVNFPQSYIDLDGSVTSPNGTTSFYSSALVHRNAVSSAIIFGSQVPMKKGFFIELYLGFGVKYMDVEHVLAGTSPTPTSGGSAFDLSFFDNEDEMTIIPIIDAGIKIGLEVLHK